MNGTFLGRKKENRKRMELIIDAAGSQERERDRDRDRDRERERERD